MFHHLLHRAVLAAAIGAGVAGLSFASEPMDEGIVVRIANEGSSETLYFDELAVGETREVTAESGKPAFVTRTEEGMEIELDGEVTKIRTVPFELAEIDALDDPELAALLEARAAGDVRLVRIEGDEVVHGDGHEVIRIHAGGDGEDGQRMRKVVVRHGDGTHAFAHGDGGHAFHISTDAQGRGKTVIVERRSRKPQGD